MLESVATSPAGGEQVRRLVQAHVAATDLADLRVVVEPTEGFELGIALWAHQQGWQGRLPHPRQVRDWPRSQGRWAKTDRQDARVLALYDAQQVLPPWPPLPEEGRERRAYCGGGPRWRRSCSKSAIVANIWRRALGCMRRCRRAWSG